MDKQLILRVLLPRLPDIVERFHEDDFETKVVVNAVCEVALEAVDENFVVPASWVLRRNAGGATTPLELLRHGLRRTAYLTSSATSGLDIGPALKVAQSLALAVAVQGPVTDAQVAEVFRHLVAQLLDNIEHKTRSPPAVFWGKTCIVLRELLRGGAFVEPVEWSAKAGSLRNLLRDVYNAAHDCTPSDFTRVAHKAAVSVGNIVNGRPWHQGDGRAQGPTT